jgi:tetratricopeptide (TPR) repeat protein
MSGGQESATRAPGPDPRAEVRAGRDLEALGAWEDAERAYRRALAADPLSADAHGFLAALLIRQRGLDEAQEALRRWASLCEDPVQAHFTLGSVLAEDDALPLAADHLQLTIDLEPRHVAAQELLGIVLAKQGDLPGSAAAWRAARALEPESPQTATGLGLALSRLGQHAEAVTLLDVGVKGTAEMCGLGRSLRELGQAARALEILDEAEKADPEVAETHLELGLTLLALGRTGPGLDALEEATRLAPRWAAAQHALGRALARAERRSLALAALLKAAALAPSDPQIRDDLRSLQDSLRGGGATPTQDSSEMSGLLDVVTLPNLLEFFTNNAASGELTITAAAGEANLFLSEGRICAASLSSGPRLGDVLVESGDLPRALLEQLLADSPDQTVAQAVAEAGLVPPDTLADRIDTLIIDTLMAAAQWTGGTFSFRRGAGFTKKAHQPHALDTRFALMEVMRRLDEAAAGR